MKKINQVGLTVCLYMLVVYCTVVVITCSQMLLNILPNTSKETILVFTAHAFGLLLCLVTLSAYASDDKNDNSKN